ncbi:MAG: hypothetical protein H7281_09295 [Bacteriovorax sp.]|nr:hypothetical protein [Bacteriovorax sp.]
MIDLKIFKEISIGGLTKDQLLQQLIEAGIQFNKYANTLFEHPSFFPQDKIETVQLVKIKSADFDLGNSHSYQEIVNQASSLGLSLCPLYLAAFLRLEYLDQPEEPYLTIASAKPENDENYPNGFYIRNTDNALWLRGYGGDDYCEWPSGNEFIFLKSI